MTLEYRRIGRLPTCVGNERIRVTADGGVSHSRNTVECESEAEAQWSASWRTAGKLDAAAMARLTQQIIDTGVLGLEPESIVVAEGGTRARDGLCDRRARVTRLVQNTDPQPFRGVSASWWWDVRARPGQSRWHPSASETDAERYPAPTMPVGTPHTGGSGSRRQRRAGHAVLQDQPARVSQPADPGSRGVQIADG